MLTIIEAYISEAINYDNFKVPSRDIQKMKEYYTKGSSPKALANTVKTLDKAVSRYYISVATGWQECENSFYDRCIALGAMAGDLAKVYSQARKDKSIDIGQTNTSKQEVKPKQTVKSTQTPKPIEKPRKVVKAKVDNDDDFFPFESIVN
jgi:hypothetical protein